MMTTLLTITAMPAVEHRVVVQLHPATRCSDVIGQLRYYRHYRFWILVTISACENVTYVRVTTSLTLNKPIVF